MQLVYRDSHPARILGFMDHPARSSSRDSCGQGRACNASSLYHALHTLSSWAVLRRSCVMQKDDDAGKLGMKIGRDLMSVAGKALRQNITELGPRVLPLSEQLIFAGNFVARKVRMRHA